MYDGDARTGKLIVCIIAAISISGDVLMMVPNIMLGNGMGIFQALVRIGFAVALICGINWVRYLFAVGSGLGAIMSLLGLIGAAAGYTPPILTIFFIIMLPCSIAACLLLFLNRHVKEFFYEKKYG
jgi:hypothetical protein